MSIIVLESAHARAEIDSNGAYLTNLTIRGADLLFPAQQIGEKTRGGIPVCAPIFGPGDSVGLKQHGFARDIGWKVRNSSDDEATLDCIAAQYPDIPHAYQGCVMTLTVKLRENLLAAELAVKNEGNEAFVCSPGFHPYFAVDDATKVTVGGAVNRSFSADELAATQFLPQHQQQVTVKLQEYLVTISSSSLQQYAVWSANPDRYICVEPTWAGNLAGQAEMPLLQPGEQKNFAMSLRWSAA